MTKEEIKKQFPFNYNEHFYGEMGVCTLCSYFETCDKILPGFIRPQKCGGPFMRNDF